MSDKLKRSANGYTYLSDNQKLPKNGEVVFHGIRESNPDVDRLWSSYNQLIGNHVPVGMLIDAIHTAKAVWGDNFRRWLTLELTANPDIQSYRVDFLVDILRKANGLAPAYSQVTWATLLGTVTDDERESQDSKLERFNDVVIIDSTNQLIANILAQHDGCAYLISTLHILFGK